MITNAYYTAMNNNSMKKALLFIKVCIVIPIISVAQLSKPSLVGYWHNWNDVNAPYIPLDQVPSDYSVVCVAFAIPGMGTDYHMEFVPDQISATTFISQIQTLQSRGQKVLISIGGATAPVALSTVQERDSFVSTMTTILATYGFDGMDIDLEGNSLATTGGTISNPVDLPVIYLIEAVRQIMTNYRTLFSRHMILTMAPETAYVQGGLSAYGGIWGAYLPVIEALKDSIDMLNVQLYNSGSMYGLDGNVYSQGTADFIVAMTESVITGFQTSGGAFSGLRADQVGVGLPACPSAAGGGYVDTATVGAALRYLLGSGVQPGSCSLQQPGGYPSLGGMMTWSVNWDAATTCSGGYSFAANYADIFSTTTQVGSVQWNEMKWYPNPVIDKLNIEMRGAGSAAIAMYDMTGTLVFSSTLLRDQKRKVIDVDTLASGLYVLKIGDKAFKMIKE